MTAKHSFHFFKLEDRVLLDAGPMPDADAAGGDGPGDNFEPSPDDLHRLDQWLHAAGGQANAPQSDSTEQPEPTANSDYLDDPTTTSRTELIYIDAGVQDADTLLRGLQTDGETRYVVVQLLADVDGVDQITDDLSSRSSVDAIHILSHGGNGGLMLGDQRLAVDTLESAAGQLARWGTSLSADADILLYGCDLAASDDGLDLIDAIATLTGADVAASDDATGHESLGGDWLLEVHHGEIQTELAFDYIAQASWVDLLATYTVTNTNDSGIGSFRQAIIDSNATPGEDDRIEFNIASGGEHVITIASAMTKITDTVTIDGTTQTGWSVGQLKIILDGNDINADLLDFNETAGGSVLRGLVVRNAGQDGVEIDAGADNVRIVGNMIGSFDGTGQLVVGRGNHVGIEIQATAGVVIGSTASTDRNWIGGNATDGIQLYNASSVTIQNNIIGLNRSQTAGMGNTQSGIALIGDASDDYLISGNVISANNAGIYISGQQSGGVIAGNWIGTDEAGRGDWGNNDDAIHINSFYGELLDLMIGGVDPGDGNVIAHSGDDNVLISGHNIDNVSLLGNSIYGAGGHEIDLGDDGINANDLGDTDPFENGLQNHAVLTASSTDASGTTISGTLATVANQQYRIEFFAAPPIFASASGHGGGERMLGFTTVTTDGAGNAAFTTTFLGSYANAGDAITATVTEDFGGGNYGATSEFSANISATATGVLVVDTISDAADGTTTSNSNLAAGRGSDGRISLREAIAATNATTNGAAVDLIAFGISGGGKHVISTTSHIGAITDAVTIDATTQSGYVDRPMIGIDAAAAATSTAVVNILTNNTTVRGLALYNGADEGLEIVNGGTGNLIELNWIGLDLNGAAAGNAEHGLLLAVGATGNMVRNNIISDNGLDGINLRDAGTGGNTFLGNWVGLGIDGVTDRGNGSNGLMDLAGGGNQIGDGTAAGRNVFAANGGVGIGFDGVATGNSVLGNHIGTDAGGTIDVGNGAVGIYVRNSGGHMIGGAGLDRNVISGNASGGIQLEGAATTGVSITGNYIGVDATGDQGLGNSGDGIQIIVGAHHNTIGGDRTTGLGNVISGNLGTNTDGIELTATLGHSDYNQILGNFIGTNASGDAAIGNARYGVVIYDGVQNTQIGGAASGQGNVISGNKASGIIIDGRSNFSGRATSGNIIVGNHIGTNVDGDLSISNIGQGIYLTAATVQTTIGGNTAAERNVISGNTSYGAVD